MTEEACQRCGEVGTDRRTLWHACFYAMEEMGLPFEHVCLSGAALTERVGTRVIIEGPPTIKGPVFAELPPDAERRDWQFYTLRVCKDCRADWMAAIGQWFNNPPARDEQEETGIYVRELGTTRMVTREEFERLHPGQIPHTISNDERG